MDKKEKKQRTPEQKKKRMVLFGASGLVVLALVVAGWIWHEQPSFCNAVCHAPMDRYVHDYYDKNNTNLIAAHGKQGDGITCLECHIPTIAQQLTEVKHWVGGTFSDPLAKRNMGNDFCLNEHCHNVTVDELRELTSNLSFNPHDWTYHGEQDCASCHRMHDVSVMSCASCHGEAKEVMPETWITPAEALDKGLEFFPKS